jgi:hypothetical protein
MDPRLDTGGWLTLKGEPLNSSFPTGTFTLQDAPGFAQRDNAKLSGPSAATHKLELHEKIAAALGSTGASC